MDKITECFATMVFDDKAMRKKLSPEIYEAVKAKLDSGKRLDPDLADAVAKAMKEWAIEKGATHYTHWFQPLTGITAEKHDSFISQSKDGNVIMDFSGKDLVKGETDASSFPSGGLRATFEARGYTAWDPSSYAFIKGRSLCIPTAFCSYGGESLDNKTPLLRSMEKINKQALRVLKLFGNNDVTSVTTTVGVEQEYFLITKEVYEKRKDLFYTGRSLFGASAPKGQELDDHYFGSIKPRVSAFMEEVDVELWKLGVLAKTEHNEAAPGQHELAPIYTTTNVAADHNQLTMEVLQNVAKKHDLVCLLHEKPFAGVNGSGKHNNWSMSTNTGVNLLNPGETPYENAQFLLFLSAFIKAVDDYQELLRISVATAGNDHRLGAAEAPPAVVSLFLGDELTGILDAIENNVPYGGIEKEVLRVGAHILPKFPKDTTDRNRTSPFAFTGNKFEFRMLGASASVSDVNTVINTAVAEVLRNFADTLESANDFETALHDLIRNTIKAHRRIIFNGNGYDDAWLEEAANRGLSNLRTTPEALAHFLDDKNVRLFTENKIFSETELRSRSEIMLESYSKLINIEALTMIEMARKQIIPSIFAYIRNLCDTVNTLKSTIKTPDVSAAGELIRELNSHVNDAYENVCKLEKATLAAKKISGGQERADYCLNNIIPLMNALRSSCDKAETLTAEEYWPLPTYGEILFSVR